MKINGLQKHCSVHLSLLHLSWKFYKVTSKIVNSAMNYVKGDTAEIDKPNFVFGIYSSLLYTLYGV